MSGFTINPAGVIAELQRRFTLKYQIECLPLTKNEMLLVEELMEAVENVCTAKEYEVERETSLYRDEPNKLEAFDDEECCEDNNKRNPNCSVLRGYEPSPVAPRRKATIEERFTLDEMRTIVDKKDIHGWKMSTIQHNFRKVTSYTDLVVMREILRGGQRKHAMYRQIREHVYSKFLEFQAAHLPIHDCDLQSWALAKATEVGCDSFSASDKWVFKFKKQFGIRSRKTTKFVTKSDVEEEMEIADKAEAFRLDFQRKVRCNRYYQIFNADQVGINLEFVSNRTLRRAGAKDVYLTIKSKSNTTHSVTIMPVIDASGRFLSPLFVCLKEKNGEFGPVVQETMYKPENLSVTCSSSGKMDKSLFRTFLETVILPNTAPKKKFLLLLDNWTPHKNEQLIAESLRNRTYDIMLIPPGTTSLCQPLDTTFNRQIKVFLKRFTEKTRHLDKMDEISGRNNFLKVLSLMHTELSSPVFYNMIRYSWYSAQLVLEKENFENVKEVCFPSCRNLACEACNDDNFITCAHSRRSLCFKCYFGEQHRH